MPAAGLVFLSLLAPALARAGSDWLIRGHGFGHGVGMSQYGAYGMAKDGAGYREILAHYYVHTKLRKLNEGESQSVRVLLSAGVSEISFSGAKTACGEPLHGDDGYSFTASGFDVILSDSRGDKLSNCGAKGAASGGRAVDYSGEGEYRGSLVARASGGALNAINDVGIEGYVKGVVPNESPPSWPGDALRAQAVAARSYALASGVGGNGYDVYDDTRSQVYGGMSSEVDAASKAVDDTSGEVVTYRGEIAVTYFSSSSGGMTESAQYGFPGSDPVPYLQAVKDPGDATSPDHNWKLTMSQEEIDSELGSLVDGKLRAVKVLKTGDSPRIVKAKIVASDGNEVVSGTELQSALGLKSTWFRVRAR
jgi:stage II sporulation protein D